VTDGIETSTGQPAADDTPGAAGSQPAAGGSLLQERAAAIADERPEVAVGAAFAGGFLLGLILRRLAR
jgi:hypothetical protein